MSVPTEVAANVPLANTGRAKLLLSGASLSGPVSVPIPVKESILIVPGKYEVIASGSTVIATIVYKINDFHVFPAIHSERDARFAVYVNLSEK